jgi:NTE family protein
MLLNSPRAIASDGKGGVAMTYKFRNLIFEGGGVKGIAYVGAMEELEKRNILENIIRVGGTSAGAINATLVALGYSNHETLEILQNLDFNNFMDDSWGIVRDTERLIQEFGWYKGEFFRKWIGQVIRAKTGNSESTFADLEAMKLDKGFRSPYFMSTNLSTRFSEIFSFEHTPRICVADAVRMSMSIPLFFAARRSARGDVYVDGGVLDNYPIKLFDRKKYLSDREAGESYSEPPYYAVINKGLEKLDRPISKYLYNKETLGFRLDTKEEISIFRDHSAPPSHKIDNFFDYAWALVDTLMEAQQSMHLHGDDWARSIYIDTLGVKTTQFDLPAEMKDRLVQSGREGVYKYFEWFDHNEAPNR